jgi:hypothetical protein
MKIAKPPNSFQRILLAEANKTISVPSGDAEGTMIQVPRMAIIAKRLIEAGAKGNVGAAKAVAQFVSEAEDRTLEQKIQHAEFALEHKLGRRNSLPTATDAECPGQTFVHTPTTSISMGKHLR